MTQKAHANVSIIIEIKSSLNENHCVTPVYQVIAKILLFKCLLFSLINSFCLPKALIVGAPEHVSDRKLKRGLFVKDSILVVSLTAPIE